MRVLSSFLIVFLCSFSAESSVFNINRRAFFNITPLQKHELITCGLDLYLKKNEIDCADLKNGVTTTLYTKFVNDFRPAYDPQGENPDWKENLPLVYRTFDNFKSNIQEICEKGESACRIIKRESYNRKWHQINTCNALCNRNTCKDLFTLSICRAMSEGQIDEQDICPPQTIQNCLSKNIPNLESALAERGWPAEWVNIDEYWDHIFLATAPEIAKGKSVALRAAEIGGGALVVGGAAVAAMAFMPMLIGVVAPSATASINFVKGQVKNIVLKQASNVANKGFNYAQDEAQKGADAAKRDVDAIRDRQSPPTYDDFSW